MRIDYANNKIEKICNDENYARRYLPPKACGNLKTLLVRLAATAHFDAFWKKPWLDKYHTENLKGRKEGIISLRIDYTNRMELIVEIKKDEDYIKILEVIGHYGD